MHLFQVCPRGERTNLQKACQRCTETPELYDWLYLGFMAMLPLVLHWFFIEWYSGKKRYRHTSFNCIISTKYHWNKKDKALLAFFITIPCLTADLYNLYSY